MRGYILSSFLLVLFLWLGVFVFAAGVLRIPDFTQTSLDGRVAVHGGQTVTQQMYSQHPGLTSIALSVKNSNLQNKKDLVLKVSEGTTILRTGSINGMYIADGKFLRFDFPAIPDSLGKTYTLEFSAPTATLEDALEIFLTKEDFPQAGNLLVSNMSYEGYRIAFVSFHKPASVGATIGQVVTDFGQRFFSDQAFVFLFGGIVGGLLFIGFWKKTDRFFERFN